MKFILGKKIEMTQVWQGGEVVAVTRVQAGPCEIVQVKNREKDGYEAVQVGFGEKKAKNIKKPQKNHLKGLNNYKYLREFRINDSALKRGDKIDIASFVAGDKIGVVGISKGKGFQGVVKRHGFKGQTKTHGNKDQLRMPGSIGATGPAHVFKGQKMPGRMGNEQVTIKNLEIIEVDEENNFLLIGGAVPGARNGLILIQGEGELKVISPQTAEKSENKDKGKTKTEIKKDTDKKEENKELEIKDNKKEEKEDIPEKIKKEVVEAKEKVDEKKAKINK